MLSIPYNVGTIITMFAITVVSETVNDRAYVAMIENFWILPFLVALRSLSDKPNPWIYYVSFSLVEL